MPRTEHCTVKPDPTEPSCFTHRVLFFQTLLLRHRENTNQTTNGLNISFQRTHSILSRLGTAKCLSNSTRSLKQHFAQVRSGVQTVRSSVFWDRGLLCGNDATRKMCKIAKTTNNTNVSLEKLFFLSSFSLKRMQTKLENQTRSCHVRSIDHNCHFKCIFKHK